jgi:hypothetical protein
MLNEDVIDLYSRVNVGAKVVVLPAGVRDVPTVAGRERIAPSAALADIRVSGVY